MKRFRAFVAILVLSFLPYGENTSFEFSKFSSNDLTLLGDSYIREGALGLTKNLQVPYTSAGRVLYSKPVRFLDKKSNASTSFSTRFSFSITNINPTSFGHGLTFLAVSRNDSIGSPGSFLGLINGTQSGNERVIGVEFDTFLNVEFHDMNDNHVGLDIGNMTSVAAADLGLLQMDLKSGDVITAWIDYNNTKKNVQVWVSYSNIKPAEPLMNVSVDFSRYVNEFMYVGFSASTSGSTEVHSVLDWEFRTFGLPSSEFASAPRPSFGPAMSPISSNKGCHGKLCKKQGLIIIVSGSCGLLICLLLGLVAWVFYMKWKKKKLTSSFKSDMVNFPRKFTYKELSVATNCFSTSRIVGHGAFGMVYKGILAESGDTVAVKRAKTHDKQGKQEFLAELSIIGSLRHRNLVHLEGWCYEKGEFLLVYEYMPNGSLDKALFQEDNGRYPTLSWGQRYKIVTGIASALAYLHGEWEQQVIHRDVKASNIMLDSSFNARLGDFGLARLIDHNKSSPDATLTAGTMGYLAPEYIQSGKASDKTDVFSFGAVVLEVACGRRPIEKDLPCGEGGNLVDWVWGLHGRGRLLEVVDPRLEGEFVEHEMKRMLLVGLSCSSPDPLERPSMRQVVQILGEEAPVPAVPSFKPKLSFASSFVISLQDMISESGSSSQSSNSFKE